MHKIFLKEEQKEKKFLYVDSECTLDGEWAKKLGVDINRLCVDQPDLEPAEKNISKNF